MPESATDVVDLIPQLGRAAAAALPPEDATAFTARAEGESPRLLELLTALYPDPVALTRALLDDALALTAARRVELRALDRRRAADPGWFQDPRMIGYVCYVDRFAETLTGVRQRLDYLGELGVSYLHLMPVLEPRAGESDGGYAVADYDAVDPRIGTMDDLTALADDLHARDMVLCVDLVLNHTAREHEWARRAMAGERHYRDFYYVFADRTLPDAYERTALDIFPELAPGTFTFVPELDGWVWTTFREFQWDLNFTNPAVFRSMFSTMLTLANRGADVLRVDAAPFLWKRLGTDCMNEPETHLLLQAFRALMTIAAPGVLLKAEAMVSPDILTRYLGAHDEYRPECDLAYDNQLMVMLWSMTATGDGRLARHALSRRPSAPPTTSWGTYLRCHDDIGWAVTDADAVAAHLEGPTHRRFLSGYFAGSVPGSPARGAVFQEGPHGASPISGTAASLIGVEAALAAGDDGALAAALARLESLYSIVFSFGGLPLMYMGDEIAMRNDRHWADDPGHAGDNRWMHRPPMDWAAAGRRDDPATPEGRMFQALRDLASARSRLPALSADGPTTLLDLGAPSLFAYGRGGTHSADGPLLALVDVGGEGHVVALASLHSAGIGRLELRHTGRSPATIVDGAVHIPPYGFAWVSG